VRQRKLTAELRSLIAPSDKRQADRQIDRPTDRERERERESERAGGEREGGREAVADPEVTGGAMRAIACTLRGSLARKGDANCASGTERRRMAQLVPVYCETCTESLARRRQVAYGCKRKKNIRGRGPAR